MRVHELATELDVKSADVIRVANEQGIDVSNPAAGLDEVQADSIRVQIELLGVGSDDGDSTDFDVANGDLANIDPTSANELALDAVGESQPPPANSSPPSDAGVTEADDVPLPADTNLLVNGTTSAGATEPPSPADPVADSVDPVVTERPKPVLPPRSSDAASAWAVRYPTLTHRRPPMNFVRPHSTEHELKAADDVVHSATLDKRGKPAVCLFNPGDAAVSLEVYGSVYAEDEFCLVGEVEVPAGTAVHVEDGLITACPYVRFVAAEPATIAVSCLG